MNTSVQEIDEVPIENTEEPTAVMNEDGICVGANTAVLDLHDFDKSELLGQSLQEILVDGYFEAGTALQSAINGDIITEEYTINPPGGTPCHMTVRLTPLQYQGNQYAKSVATDIKRIEDGDIPPEVGTDEFEDISKKELAEITQSVRVDCPDGEMPLNAIMMDLAVGHNELEQYKQGALTLYECLQTRLEEEKGRNPGSTTATVIESVMDTAFGLYLRLQRGDQELHGERDGEYSGYFD